MNAQTVPSATSEYQTSGILYRHLRPKNAAHAPAATRSSAMNESLRVNEFIGQLNRKLFSGAQSGRTASEIFTHLLSHAAGRMKKAALPKPPQIASVPYSSG